MRKMHENKQTSRNDDNSVLGVGYPNEPRTEFLDKIKLSNGRTIERYRHYFSGKMEIIEVSISSYT